MRWLRVIALLALTALLTGANYFGPIAGSRLRSGGGPSYDSETLTWISRVDAAGGTYAGDSKSIADALIVALKAKSYQAKIIYLLPLLGSNLAAARVPLRDTLAVGIAGNLNFVAGDFSQSTGLQGDGSSKLLDSLIKPSQLGTSNNGGIGLWTNSFSAAGGTELMGCSGDASGGDNRYLLDIRTSGAFRFFSWGGVGNRTTDSTAGTSGDYYGQRSGATSRTLYFDGSPVNTNTTSDSATGSADRTIRILGQATQSITTHNASRCAVAYLTDGTLSDADVADLHTLLSTYLITPTGR